MTAGGQVWQPYLRGNLWRDWGAEADAVYSGTDLVPLASQVTRLELGGGLTGRINANVSVFANVDYEFAVGAARERETKRRSRRVWRQIYVVKPPGAVRRPDFVPEKILPTRPHYVDLTRSPRRRANDRYLRQADLQ